MYECWVRSQFGILLFLSFVCHVMFYACLPGAHRGQSGQSLGVGSLWAAVRALWTEPGSSARTNALKCRAFLWTNSTLHMPRSCAVLSQSGCISSHPHGTRVTVVSHPEHESLFSDSLNGIHKYVIFPIPYCGSTPALRPSVCVCVSMHVRLSYLIFIIYTDVV